MMMILPSTSDGATLLTALKNMHARLLEHASLLWVPETTDAIRTAHESVIGQILTMNLLRIQAFWSHYRFRRQNPLLNYLLHQQLRMTSVISSLRRMLLNWPRAGPHPRVLESLLNELATPPIFSVARIIAPLAPPRTPTTAISPSGSACAISVVLSGEQPLAPPRRKRLGDRRI
jgi:hypothetical protein